MNGNYILEAKFLLTVIQQNKETPREVNQKERKNKMKREE